MLINPVSILREADQRSGGAGTVIGEGGTASICRCPSLNNVRRPD
jgi:hypothetical protein